VSEVTGLRWRDVNLPASTLTVVASKTEAGVREVELDPALLDVLKTHKANSGNPAPEVFVFPGRSGGRRDRHAVRNRVLYPAIKRANLLLTERGLPTIPDGTDGRPRVTFHSLRRTYASIAAEAGVDPAWTAAQIGHTDPRFTIKVYTDVSNRRQGAAERVGELIRSAEWAPLGTNGDSIESPPEQLKSESALESL
jgi:integrase